MEGQQSTENDIADGLQTLFRPDSAWRSDKQAESMRGWEEHTAHAAGGDARHGDEHSRGAVRRAQGRLGDASEGDRRRLHPVQGIDALRTGRHATSSTAGGRERRCNIQRRVFGLCGRAAVRRAAAADIHRRVPHDHHGRRVPCQAGRAAELAPIWVPDGATDSDAAGNTRGLVPQRDTGRLGRNGTGLDDEAELPLQGRAGQAR
ncbi:unnamed protein product, partial [Clonostachys chloroleuca]